MKIVLLLIGILMLIVQEFIQPISDHLQFILLVAGIVVLGIPHGAADLLVASQYARERKIQFSKLKFHFNYVSRLFLFALVLWFFPLPGYLLFILFAAYHFGETDLHRFKINTVAGNLLVVSYGLVIMGVMLLVHFEEVMQMSRLVDSGKKYLTFVDGINHYRYSILLFCGLFFLATFIFYYIKNHSLHQNYGSFLIQSIVLLFILYTSPMIVGFTFYFILWHSVLSLKNIVWYLRKDGLVQPAFIAKQISLYSLSALVGIFLFGLTGFFVASDSTILIYGFLALAVLTAPHMQIMHTMYNSFRTAATPAEKF